MNNIFCIVILMISFSAYAQELPPDPKAGECYIKFNNERKIEWVIIPCELNTDKYKNKTYLTELQTFYKNLGYDIKVSGIMDLQTIAAYKDYNNGMRKLKKQQRKAARKTKRKNKKS